MDQHKLKLPQDPRDTKDRVELPGAKKTNRTSTEQWANPQMLEHFMHMRNGTHTPDCSASPASGNKRNGARIGICKLRTRTEDQETWEGGTEKRNAKC